MCIRDRHDAEITEVRHGESGLVLLYTWHQNILAHQLAFIMNPSDPTTPTHYTWAGRFSEPMSDLVKRYTASVDFDKRMWRQDIRGSLAHAKMLATQGIISAEDRADIERGMAQIVSEIDSGAFEWSLDLEAVSYTHLDVYKRQQQGLPLRLSILGCTLFKADDRVLGNQGTAVQANKTLGKFFFQMRQRFVEQVVSYGGSRRDVFEVGLEVEDLVQWNQQQTPTFVTGKMRARALL